MVDNIVEKLTSESVLSGNGWLIFALERETKNDMFALSQKSLPLLQRSPSPVVLKKRGTFVLCRMISTQWDIGTCLMRCVSSEDTKIQLRRSEPTANEHANDHIQPDEESEGLFSHATYNVSVLGELKLYDANATAQDVSLRVAPPLLPWLTPLRSQ